MMKAEVAGPPNAVLDAFPQSNRLQAARIRPITVPLWLGAERRGVELGASLLDTLLRARWRRRSLRHLLDRLQATVAITADEPVDADYRVDRRALDFLSVVEAASRDTAAAVATCLATGSFPIVLGGDHAVSFGSVAGAASVACRLGVLWFDAHPDLNTPVSSPSGHIHGMVLASALGYGLPALTTLGGSVPLVSPNQVCLLGVRDVDPGERELIGRLQIWTMTMAQWSDLGIIAGLEAALSYLREREVDAVHVSFDVDVLDPTLVPGTGTPVPGGLTYREAEQIMRRLQSWTGPISSLDWVELNPALDRSGLGAEAATGLLSTLLGEVTI
jgi:arginase